ncbi:MAG: hypothetical protein MPJ50_03925 [Pirellulales bacterium]|nr:hypothetical protein [Pirellulales bacterium]
MIQPQSKIRTKLNLGTPLRLLMLLTVVVVVGCSLAPKLPEGISKSRESKSGAGESTISERADAATQTAIVSNPLAKEIRFSGQELVLGGGTCRALSGDELRQAVRQLLDGEKKRSATAMVNLHVRSAQRMLIDGVGEPNDYVKDFVAGALDHGKPQSVWTSHRMNCKSRPEVARRFAWAKEQIVSTAQSNGSIEKSIGQLEQAAREMESLPLHIESQRLTALANVAAGNSEKAVTTLASAAELAARSSLPNISSDLWMMACQASMQLENVSQARKCWKAAVANQLTAVRSRPANQLLPAVDTVFWEQAAKLKHPADQFPAELNLAFAPWYSRIGFTPSTETAPQVALWSAVAEFQLTTGQPHLAALSIKRAEVGAAESTKPWLRIALARAMAAQGQESVAVTILGSLNNHSIPAVRAASLATLGSIKVQAGAYEQGSRFLIEALNTQQAGKWPGQLDAKADLANVRLIVGQLDQALLSLHSVQNEMMAAGRWQSLCQSLENEAAILEHEGRHSRAIRERIRAIENG